MNETQQKVWDYLIDGGSRPERQMVLHRLVEQNFFSIQDINERSIERIDVLTTRGSGVDVLDGCCDDGVRRFREAILPKPVEDNRKYEVEYTIKITVEQTADPADAHTRADYNDFARSRFTHGPNEFLDNLEAALVGVEGRVFRHGAAYKVTAAETQQPECGWHAGPVSSRPHITQIAGHPSDSSGHFTPKED